MLQECVGVIIYILLFASAYRVAKAIERNVYVKNS